MIVSIIYYFQIIYFIIIILPGYIIRLTIKFIKYLADLIPCLEIFLYYYCYLIIWIYECKKIFKTLGNVLIDIIMIINGIPNMDLIHLV